MSRFGGPDIPVTLPGGCQCPGTPHGEGDIVLLLPRLSYEGGAEAGLVINRYIGKDDTDAFGKDLGAAYLRHQVRGWNLVDEAGQPVPYSADLLLSDWHSARAVADKADDLYSEALLGPLVAAVSTYSPDGQTADSTSPSPTSTTTRRKR